MVDFININGKFIGKEALGVLYKSNSNGEVEEFIEDVVLKGIDPLKENRLQFLKNVVMPPSGRAASQNIYDFLLAEFNGVTDKK
mgnify:CR=1 FL=1